jgi:hypothetical protein
LHTNLRTVSKICTRLTLITFQASLHLFLKFAPKSDTYFLRLRIDLVLKRS